MVGFRMPEKIFKKYSKSVPFLSFHCRFLPISQLESIPAMTKLTHQ